MTACQAQRQGVCHEYFYGHSVERLDSSLLLNWWLNSSVFSDVYFGLKQLEKVVMRGEQRFLSVSSSNIFAFPYFGITLILPFTGFHEFSGGVLNLFLRYLSQINLHVLSIRRH